MKKFVMDQQEEVCKAILGTGQYILKEKYMHLSVSLHRWFTSFTAEQKDSARKKFQKAPLIVCEKGVLQHGRCKNDQIFWCEGDQPPEQEESQLPQHDEESQLPQHDEESQLPQHGNEQLPQQEVKENQHLSVDLLYASHQTSIPTLFLQHMWSKAAELVLNHQVACAPGCQPSSCMVASRSNTRPHLVSLSKDGRYECDDTCPSFLQHCICSHSIAAAEDNGHLKEFVDGYAKFAKACKGQKKVSPNYIGLSMTNLPKHTAGRKGNKPPAKKTIARRKTVPYKQRTSLLTPTNLGVPSTSNPLVSITSSGNWNWNWDGVPSTAGTLNYSQPWYPPSYPPPLPYNELGFMPFADLTNYMASQFNYDPYLYAEPSNFTGIVDRSTGYAVPSSSEVVPTSSGVSEPFILKCLNGRIKVCAGCKGPHVKGADNGLLFPPFDICLGHKELLYFTNPKNGQECSKIGNAYYHINLECIKNKHPSFTAAQIECPPDMYATLSEAHHKLLREAIGYAVD